MRAELENEFSRLGCLGDAPGDGDGEGCWFDDAEGTTQELDAGTDDTDAEAEAEGNGIERGGAEGSAADSDTEMAARSFESCP